MAHNAKAVIQFAKAVLMAWPLEIQLLFLIYQQYEKYGLVSETLPTSSSLTF